MESRRTRRKPDPPAKTGKWVVRVLVWVVFLYCAWGYRSYMTTMNQAIHLRNEGIDLINEEKYDEALPLLEKAKILKGNSRRNLFVTLAYDYLPKKELPLRDDLATCYYQRGIKRTNNREENLDREALEDFERAFRLKPDIPGLARETCQLAFVRKEWEIAFDAAEEALKQSSGDVMLKKIRDAAKKELHREE